MNETGASNAMRAIADGDASKADALIRWLHDQVGIGGLYLDSDLRMAVESCATGGSDGGLAALQSSLRGRPESVLAFFLDGVGVDEVFELPGAAIGPARLLRRFAPTVQALEAWPADAESLAVIARHPAQGRLGAIRTAAWLQTILGAISLAAYARARSIAPLVACPAIGTAMYLTTETGDPAIVDKAALGAPGPIPADQVEGVLSEPEFRAIVDDCTSLEPKDLVQKRLTLAVRPLQLAASAISTADALIALGVALETIAGDEQKGAVVDRITKRAAIFLASGSQPDDRGDIYYEELKRAKKLYDLRSRAAHGQLDEWTSDQTVAERGREEFHRFVLDVALAFRHHARARNMRDGADFARWWKRAELEGIFA